jgi:hypothetical protein
MFTWKIEVLFRNAPTIERYTSSAAAPIIREQAGTVIVACENLSMLIPEGNKVSAVIAQRIDTDEDEDSENELNESSTFTPNPDVPF